VVPGAMNSVIRIPLQSQNSVVIFFFVRQCSFEFLEFVGRMRVHPLLRLFLCFRIVIQDPSLIASNDKLQKISLIVITCEKR